MALHRRRNRDPFDLLPPIVGLLLIGVFFIPGFKQLLGSLFVLLVGAGVLGIAVWIGWRLFKNVQSDPAGAPQPATQVVPSSNFRFPDGAEPSVELPEQDWSLALLKRLEWKRFEDVVAAYLQELGQTARTTRIGPDGGVDVEVLDPVTKHVVMLVQCKAWEAYKVGIKPVRELYGVMAAAKVPDGAFFTTGEFTQEAQSFGAQNHLDLIDGAELISRIRQLPMTAQLRLRAVATDGDFTTPTCPNCGVKMVRRTASKGRSEGQEFWGCRNYPRCRQTFRS